MAHELVHALTVNNYHNPRTAEQKKAVAELNRLARAGKKALKGETWYGTQASDQDTLSKEFLAEALTNPLFQERLAREAYGDKTLWTRFVEAIAELLGTSDPTMLSEALRLAEALSATPTFADGKRGPVRPADLPAAEYTAPDDEAAPAPLILPPAEVDRWIAESPLTPQPSPQEPELPSNHLCGGPVTPYVVARPAASPASASQPTSSAPVTRPSTAAPSATPKT